MCNIIRFPSLADLSCFSCLKRRGQFRQRLQLSRAVCCSPGFCFEWDRKKAAIKAKPLCFQLLPSRNSVFSWEPQKVNSRAGSKIRNSGQDSNPSFLHMTELFVTKAVAWSDLVRYGIRFGITPIKILQELGLQPRLQKSLVQLISQIRVFGERGSGHQTLTNTWCRSLGSLYSPWGLQGGHQSMLTHSTDYIGHLSS